MVGPELCLPLPHPGEKVCFLSVMHLNGKVYESHLAMKAFEYGNSFDTVGLGKACRRSPVFNFVSDSLGLAIRMPKLKKQTD